MKKTNYKLIQATVVWILSLIFVATPALSSALEIKNNPGAPVENRFVVGPAKIETSVNPGESKTVNIDLENRTGRDGIYEVHFEDFVAGKEDGQSVDFLGSTKSSTSLKDDLFVPETKITLSHGDRVRVPVTISIPVGANPGGKFASAIFTASPTNIAATDESNATVLGRIAVLLFVTVPGDANQEGKLEKVSTAGDKKVFFGGEVPLRIAFRNTGDVHLDPYGGVTVTNMFGHIVETKSVDPWFVLPKSVRTRDISLPSSGYFGWYKATVELNRGYGDLVDTESLTFFAISPVSGLLVVLIALALGLLLWSKKKKK